MRIKVSSFWEGGPTRALGEYLVELVLCQHSDEIGSLHSISGKPKAQRLTLVDNATDSPPQALRERSGFVYTSMACFTTLGLAGFVLGAPRLHNSVQGVESGIKPFVNYSLAKQRVGEDASRQNFISTNFVHTGSPKLPGNDLTIKPVKNEVNFDEMAYQQPWRHYYQLKLIPKSQEPRVQHEKQHCYLRSVTPVADAGTQKPEPNSGGRLAGRLGPLDMSSTRRSNRARVCWNCQMRTSVS